MNASSARLPPLWTRPFVLVSLANLTIGIASSFAIHLPGFLRELGAGEAEIGRIFAVHPLAALLFGPPVGRALDRHGRRAVIRTGGVLYASVNALYLAVDSISPFVYCVRVLEGVSHTLLYAAFFTFAADIVPAARRTEGLALFGASGLLPMGLSALLGDVILEAGSYRAMYATALAIGLGGVLLCWPLRDVAATIAGTAAAERARAPWWAPFLQRDLVPIWIASFTFFFAMAGVLAFLKTFVLTTGRGSAGSFFMAYALVALVLRVGFGWLPDRIGLRRMVLPSIAAYALGTLALALARSDAHVLLAGLLCGIGHSYAYPVFFSLVIARARQDERGAAMGVYTAVDWAGMLAAGWVLGELIEAAGYTAAFLALGATLALGTALFYAFDRAGRAGSRPR